VLAVLAYLRRGTGRSAAHATGGTSA
jgi:hypothetical protein